MTVIVFLLDNSTPMNQRTFQGTTLLDVAKTVAELFFKSRINKSRVDRYFIFTLDAEPNFIKLSALKQNVDIQSIHSALNNINVNGQISLSAGILRVFRMLNLNRLQLGLENYGMGIYPSFVEPAVVVCITGTFSANYLSETVLNDGSLTSIESILFGNDLTSDSFRWDYRLYSIILRFPAFPNYMFSKERNCDPCSILKMFSENTGGESFELYEQRDVNHCLDSLVLKCYSCVVVEFIKFDDSSNNCEWDINQPSVYTKQLMLVEMVGRISSCWPIPEPYWPDEEIISSHMPSRSAHPKIYVSNIPISEINLPEFFPIDKYELAPSVVTNELINYPNRQVVWQCSSYCPKIKQKVPFGFLKVLNEVPTVYFHVLPYNYPIFTQLFADLCDHHMRITETWRQQFVNYLNSIPKYYFMPLAKTFERLGFPGIIKSEAVDRAIPYQLKHSLQKLRHSAKIEYDNFMRLTQTEEAVPNSSIILPSTILPLSLWPLREIKITTLSKTRQSNTVYRRPSDIMRCDLRLILAKMRHTLKDLLNGKVVSKKDEFIHQQPIALMGDYVNYRMSHDKGSPLREINPGPERSDTFGNPFRRKSSSSFVADEGFVDEMSPLGLDYNPNTSLISSGRKKLCQIKNSQQRTKGPIPAYINRLNWRCFSPKNSPPSSPKIDEVQFQLSPSSKCNFNIDNYNGIIQNNVLKTTLKNSERTLNNGFASKSSRETFKVNRKLLNELVAFIRQPYTDSIKLFKKLKNIIGCIGQQDAVVSMLMSEALRFKRIDLYLLLSDWRVYVIQNNNPQIKLKTIRCTRDTLTNNGFQVNGCV